MNAQSAHEPMPMDELGGLSREWSHEGALNILLASSLILVLLPLMGLIALVIRWVDGGPVLYRGVRLGRDLQPFTMYKFRTLRVGSESVIGSRLLRDGEGFITPVGRLLRRLKLDEFPQLFNILKRDMDFVGPRPVRPALAEEYSVDVPRYGRRFTVRPGLTGLAQLRGGYYCEPRRKTRYDLFYIQKKTLLLDLKLLALTGLRMIISPDCLKSGDRPPLGSAQIADAKTRPANGSELAA